jgi:hypothetical protein
MHFIAVLLSNQSQFFVMFKFFVPYVSPFATHFHQLHLKFIQDYHALRRDPTRIYVFPWLLSQSVFCSVLAMHFRLIVLSHWLVEIQMRRFESGPVAASPVRAKGLKSARPVRAGQGGKVLQCDWKREDGKCGEGDVVGLKEV